MDALNQRRPRTLDLYVEDVFDASEEGRVQEQQEAEEDARLGLLVVRVEGGREQHARHDEQRDNEETGVGL